MPASSYIPRMINLEPRDYRLVRRNSEIRMLPWREMPLFDKLKGCPNLLIRQTLVVNHLDRKCFSPMVFRSTDR